MSESLFSIAAALAHLRRADPVLAGVIDEIGPFDWLQRSDPYLALVRTILFQQLAGPGADAVLRPLFVFFRLRGAHRRRPPRDADAGESAGDRRAVGAAPVGGLVVHVAGHGARGAGHLRARVTSTSDM